MNLSDHARNLNIHERDKRNPNLARASGIGISSKIGRNDPCPCGSGKKYKHCHLKQNQK